VALSPCACNCASMRAELAARVIDRACPFYVLLSERMGGTVLISGGLACAAGRLTSTVAGVKACGAFCLPGVEKTGGQLAFFWRDRACATVAAASNYFFLSRRARFLACFKPGACATMSLRLVLR
jgi:hypothetical protein